MIGIFRACSKAQFDIERDAWKGKFAAQVRVELIGKLQRIKDATFILKTAGSGMGQLASGVPVPHPVQGRDVMEKVLAYFKEPMTPAAAGQYDIRGKI